MNLNSRSHMSDVIWNIDSSRLHPDLDFLLSDSPARCPSGGAGDVFSDVVSLADSRAQSATLNVARAVIGSPHRR